MLPFRYMDSDNYGALTAVIFCAIHQFTRPAKWFYSFSKGPQPYAEEKLLLKLQMPKKKPSLCPQNKTDSSFCLDPRNI